MTIVGHTLTGATIGLMVLPRYRELWCKMVFILSFMILAYMPDIPIPGWGHDRYHISHSLFVNVTLITVFLSVLLILRNSNVITLSDRILFWGAVAWLSHLVLDSFYNHGMGIAIFWPLSRARLILPMPWFETLRKPYVSMHSLKVFTIEFLFYFPMTLMAFWLRKYIIINKNTLKFEKN